MQSRAQIRCLCLIEFERFEGDDFLSTLGPSFDLGMLTPIGVTLGASMLLSPLLWDHYLATLVLPAAFLAARGRPVALLLPLLTWLPAPVLPLVVVVATVSPFWARDRAAEDGQRQRVASPVPSPA